MTSFDKIYEAFLSKMLDDEWGNWQQEDIEIDLRQLLESAIPRFKFPRISLNRTDEGFEEDLDSEEIQILATYMKCEWLNRTILTWEHIKPLYEEREFSQANLIDKLNQTLEAERKAAEKVSASFVRPKTQGKNCIMDTHGNSVRVHFFYLE